MNLLNGKPLPARLSHFPCRDVVAVFSSESDRKGWGRACFASRARTLVNSFAKSKEQNSLPSNDAIIHNPNPTCNTHCWQEGNFFWVVFLFLKLVNSTKVFQMLSQNSKYGTSLPQSPEVSETEIFNTNVVKHKHESLRRGKRKAEIKARGWEIVVRFPLLSEEGGW